MTDEELRDQLMTLLLAGHETTATGLAWTLERLVRQPSILERAIAGDDTFIDAVVMESLRVRPVIMDIARMLTQPASVGGYDLPAGVIVAPAILLAQTSPANHDDPLRFDPDRWEGRHPDPSTWLPFGGGNRRCLGAAFAQTEMRVVLREVLRRVDLAVEMGPGERPRIRHVTLVPGKGSRITVRARRRVPQDAPAPDRARAV
jgi:cytochrome P450